jgi:hypothetical protein
MDKKLLSWYKIWISLSLQSTDFVCFRGLFTNAASRCIRQRGLTV